MTKQVQTLSESLQSESARRGAAEKQAAELSPTGRTERELAQRTQAQEQLRAELAEQQKRSRRRPGASKPTKPVWRRGPRNWQPRKRAVTESQAEHASVTLEVQTLSESLKNESGRREAAERQAAELAARAR